VSSDKTVAIVPAAGRGVRFGADRNKVFLALGDRPLLAHTLAVFEACGEIDEVVVAVGEGEEDVCRREVLEPFELRKVTGVIRGGASRQESVGLALRYIGSGAGVVVVHDGARPLLPPPLLEAAVRAGRAAGAVVVGLPVGDTVKRVGRVEEALPGYGGGPGEPGAGPSERRGRGVLETLDRTEVWRIQTPQVFWRDLLEMAHLRAADGAEEATDDAHLVERLRHPVLVIPGSAENLKVTSPLDLVLARAILAERARRDRAGDD